MLHGVEVPEITTWRCWGTMKIALCQLKAPQGFETETRELLGRMKENNVLPMSDLPSGQINDILQKAKKKRNELEWPDLCCLSWGCPRSNHQRLLHQCSHQTEVASSWPQPFSQEVRPRRPEWPILRLAGWDVELKMARYGHLHITFLTFSQWPIKRPVLSYCM